MRLAAAFENNLDPPGEFERESGGVSSAVRARRVLPE